MGPIASVLSFALWMYLLLLIGRMIISYVQIFARSWEPRGAMAALFEAIFTATDPPLKWLRKFIKPVRLGTVAFDLSFTVLFIVVLVMMRIVSGVPI